MYQGRTVLVDLDGTVADNNHRQHFLRGHPKNWPAYNANMIEDGVHHDIVWLVKLLHSAGCRIVICTARTADHLETSRRWLDEKAGLKGIYEKIYIRGEKDYRDDTIVKGELLDEIIEDGHDPFLVIDDRAKVVNMWRERGLRCLAVAEGNF